MRKFLYIISLLPVLFLILWWYCLINALASGQMTETAEKAAAIITLILSFLLFAFVIGTLIYTLVRDPYGRKPNADLLLTTLVLALYALSITTSFYRMPNYLYGSIDVMIPYEWITLFCGGALAVYACALSAVLLFRKAELPPNAKAVLPLVNGILLAAAFACNIACIIYGNLGA